MADDELLPFDPSLKTEKKKIKATFNPDASPSPSPSPSEADTLKASDYTSEKPNDKSDGKEFSLDSSGMKGEKKMPLDLDKIAQSLPGFNDAKENKEIPLETEENIDASKDELVGAEGHAAEDGLYDEDSESIKVDLLLAETYKEGEIDPTGWWMSEKLDGFRAYWDGKDLYSRTGKPFKAPKWFTVGWPVICLDGELYMGRQKFEKTSSIIKTKGSQDWYQIRFHVFDIPSMDDAPFETRKDAIQQYLHRYPSKYTVCVEQKKCNGHQHVLEELNIVLSNGGEGLMLRKPESLYEKKRSFTLLKVKKWYHAAARVVEHKFGQGELKDKVLSLRCEMESGEKFSVSSGLKKTDWEDPPAIDSIIAYRFQEYTGKKIPRRSVFIDRRNDLNGPKDAEVITKASED